MNVPRRENSRKGFTSPKGLEFLEKIGPKKRTPRSEHYGQDPRRDVKPKVRKLGDHSIAFDPETKNPYPYTTAATRKERGE
jgi:hypothetical protein